MVEQASSHITGRPEREAAFPGDTRDWRSRVPGATAGVLFVVALLCVTSAVGLALFGGMQPIRRIIDDVLLPAPPNLAYGGFLGVLAAALARRKYIAHWILLVMLVLQLVADLLVIGLLTLTRNGMYAPVDSEPFSEWLSAANIPLTVGGVVVLLLARREFVGRAQPGSIRKAAGVFALLTAVFIGVGYGIVNVFPGSLDAGWDRFSWTVERVLGGAVIFDITRTGNAPGWVNLVLGLFGSAALFAALYTLFRSQRVAATLRPADELRIRELLAEHGERDSLGYFATRRDKAVLFSTSGKAAITYRVVGGVCLASGDPLGDPEAWRPVIDRWLAMCREYAWTPAVLGASEQGAGAYARAGLKALQFGDEAILHTSEFTLSGRDMRPVRQAFNRIKRSGHTVQIRRHSELSPEEMAEVQHLAHEWRDTETERGFSMALGRLGDPADRDCVLVEALDATGATVGLLSFTPWGGQGLSLDLMRRDRDSDNGLVEFMIASLVQSGSRLGVDRISLNFAMFRSAFEEGARLGAGPVLRAWRGLLMFFSRWWQLESLYRSNVKYLPHWVPRFVLYGERRDLAKVGVAAAVAEGFLSLPGNGTPKRSTGAARDDAWGRLAEVTPQRTTRPAPRRRTPEQVRVRMEKLAQLREEGMEPYPVSVPRMESCRAVRDRYPDLPPDKRTGESTAVAGRVVLLRDHGGVCFATVRDWSGDLQVMVTAKDCDSGVLRDWRKRVDLGDQVSVRGEVVTSEHGELSVLVHEWAMAGKCLHPLPDKHRGLTEPEARVRQRYLDLVVRPAARETLRSRGAAIHALRDLLLREDFLEVETPVLQPVHGGASARPFTTHINAYDMRLYLRIAPELYLKRLCVGGVERVFEIARVFRNEGVSYKHNPEFTMLEAYQAFGDYHSVRKLCQRLVQSAAVAANGDPVARHTDRSGHVEEVDLSGDWPVMGVHEALSERLGTEITTSTSIDDLRKVCDQARISHDPAWERGTVLLEMYERVVEPNTTQPTFYTDFPVEVSPLARQHRTDPRVAERWDLVAFGAELATGYSELTDPVEQRRRLEAQSWLAANGDPEAMEVDEDFLTALEYAMPPTGGLGVGVDRLVMLLTGKTLRETTAFPLVKPNRAGAAAPVSESV